MRLERQLWVNITIKHGNNIILIGLIVMLLSTSTMLFIGGNSAGYWLAIIFTHYDDWLRMHLFTSFIKCLS